MYYRQYSLCLARYYNETCVLLSIVDSMLYALLVTIMRPVLLSTVDSMLYAL